MSQITPMVLVGGSGKRLWPLSCERMSKQFLSLLDKQSTSQQTLERVVNRRLFATPMVATNEQYRVLVEQQAMDIGLSIDILVEPSRRDSGPATAAAAACAHKRGAKSVFALASDHPVLGAEKFHASCRDGLHVCLER
jgi:mannose-1-phosphate guanylyltransferase/mannose-6-phosphate isomerase